MAATFRHMDLAELRRTLDWAADESWNPGLDDAPAFFATDPHGFFLAEIDGRPVASISVVNHTDDFAFLGLYICRPEQRGRGIGIALWRHAIAHGGARTIGLDGVPAQQANYRKSGFVEAGATLRLEGAPAARADPAIRPLAASDVAALIALDAAANGFRKERFLTAWLAPTPTRSTVVLGGDQPEGFATIRTGRRGSRVGPVVAPDAAAALRLIRAAAVGRPTPIVVDVPAANAALVTRLTAEGFVTTFPTARMYRGTPPRPGPALQAVGTLELG